MKKQKKGKKSLKKTDTISKKEFEKLLKKATTTLPSSPKQVAKAKS